MMSLQHRVEVIRRLVEKGEIFSAEVACDDWGISKNVISKFMGERMLIIEKSENKYRRAYWWEKVSHWVKKNGWEFYKWGCVVVGATLFVFTLYIICISL